MSSDVISLIGTSILTPVLWIGLFLWAWSRPAQARASGFGRMTFWLLLPGAFLGSLADAPFFPWAGNVLAINIGGALIPVLLSLVLLRREFGSTGWAVTAGALLVLAAETAIQFAVVVLVSGNWSILLVTAAAGGVPAFAILAFPLWMPRPVALRAVTFLGLASAALALTFATSSAVPGVGIVSAFPLYLLGPVVVGVASVSLAVTLWGSAPFQGLGVGYAAATFGTLIGADVLREPPLYTGGGGGLLAIGGAGVQDLVYFSGLLAIGTGLLLIAARYRGASAGMPSPASSARSPDQALHAAAERLAASDPVGAGRDALAASQAAAERARSAWQLPTPSQPSEAWDGLPVAPYVLTDYRNLLAAAGQPTTSMREAFRQVAMAAQLVRLSRDLSRLRFAPLGRRAWAMVLDLAIVTAPAVVLWSVLSLTLRGSLTAILNGLAFNLAVFAFVAYALLYFVVCDALFGATPGKRLFGLRVTDRSMARPTFLQSVLRESPKAVPLFVIGEFGAPALLFLVRASGSPISTLGISLVLFTGAVLLALVAAVVVGALSVGAVQVARDAERQRLGDRWASTWVVDRRVVTPAWGARLATPPARSEPAPPG